MIELTKVTIDWGTCHMEKEVMYVTTDSQAHEMVVNYANDNGYSLKEEVVTATIKDD